MSAYLYRESITTSQVEGEAAQVVCSCRHPAGIAIAFLGLLLVHLLAGGTLNLRPSRFRLHSVLHFSLGTTRPKVLSLRQIDFSFRDEKERDIHLLPFRGAGGVRAAFALCYSLAFSHEHQQLQEVTLQYTYELSTIAETLFCQPARPFAEKNLAECGKIQNFCEYIASESAESKAMHNSWRSKLGR